MRCVLVFVVAVCAVVFVVVAVCAVVFAVVAVCAVVFVVVAACVDAETRTPWSSRCVAVCVAVCVVAVCWFSGKHVK